jgi:NADH-ubiquinone oxidoreductase chain 5
MIFLFSCAFLVFYLFLMSIFVFVFYHGGYLLEYFWLFKELEFSLTFIFDFLSIGFFSCVSFISGLVFLYRIFYMEGTVDMRRFLWLVCLFVVSMFLLVFGGNFFMLIVG